MPHNAACSKLPPIALAIALILLSACATGGSDPGDRVAVCPAVVEYDQGFRERAADELQQLPTASVIEKMLHDYLLLRQMTVHGCQ